MVRWQSCLVLAATSSSSSFAFPATSSHYLPPRRQARIKQHLHRLYASSTQKSDDEIEKETMEWVQNVVVGWNLCPFAEKSIRKNSLKLETVRGNDEETILGSVLGECMVRKDIPGTTLIIAPDCFPLEFERYLEYVNALEELMVEYELDGHVQVAPFHPLFEFEGSGKDGIDNYTNRSPYPIFHVLRESEVESAVDKLGGDASRVWKRNVDLLQDMKETLGSEQDVKNAMTSTSGNMKEKIREVLKRHRFQVDDKKN